MTAHFKDSLPESRGRRPHVIIVGDGPGGLAAAKSLAGADADVTLIGGDSRVFEQPLRGAATMALAPNRLASPFRLMIRRQRNLSIILDEVINVDGERKEVILRDRAIAFDRLIFAAGAPRACLSRADCYER